MTKSKAVSLLAGLSIWLNFILFGVKLWVGILSNSVAIIADAWHTLSDSISSIIVYISLKFASKPADKKHPFGHGRMDLIASLIIGIMLCLVGYHFISASVTKLIEKHVANYGKIAVFVTLGSIVIKEIMSQYSIFFGKKFQTKSLIADGWHHRSDALSSMLILIGILFGKKLWWVDGVLGIGLSVIIFYAAYEVLKKAISSLLGEEIDEKKKKELAKFVQKNCDRELKLHHLHLHDYGIHKEVTMHIKLPAIMTLQSAHMISERLESLLHEKFGYIATIHIDPE